MLRYLVLVLGLVTAACAARDERDLRAEFQAAVEAASSCEVLADCVSVTPGCPLGCGVAVNRAKRAEIEAKARELVDEYESDGQSCAYGCAPTELACTGGRCALHAR